MSESVEREFPGGMRARVLAHRAPMHDFATWEREPREWMAENLRPGMVVLDVGAEEGETSVLAAKLVGPENVHVIEAAQWSWPNIRACWWANFGDAMPGGVWTGFVADAARAEESAALNAWPECAYGPIRLDGAFVVHHERPEIPTTTVDRYCAQLGISPDVIMMDVEGCEHRVLVGAQEQMRRGVRFLASIHAEATLAYYGTSEAAILRWLEDHGYGWRLISRDHETHLLLAPEATL